jgi:ectoine hydroxylase-related dioxygenase (phytanoyl-CoA dioxygenase family)
MELEDGLATELRPLVGERLWIDVEDEFKKRVEATEDLDLVRCAYAMRDDGFVHLRGAVPESLIEEAISAYEHWCESANVEKMGSRADGRRPRVVNLHTSKVELKDLYALSNDVTRVVDYLFGYKSSVYTSLTFQYGTEQPFHRDTPVFRTEPEEFYYGVWFALEDADERNGALRALRGGHRDGRVDPFNFARTNLASIEEQTAGGAPLWTPYQVAVVTKCREEGCEEVLIPAKRGDVVIWHPQLPHGGSAIKEATRTRKSVVFHVTPENVPVYQADVFFNENISPSRVSKFRYTIHSGRQFAIQSTTVGSN